MRRSGPAGGGLVLALLAASLLACAGPAEAPAPAREPELAARLVELGEEALGEGKLDLAAERFERAVRADPEAAGPRWGAGLVALERGRTAAARRALEAALARDPEHVPAELALAGLAEREGKGEEARRRLERVVALAPRHPEAHARLAALTGRAPRPLPTAAGKLLALASEHPYDAALLVRTGRALARAGRPERAKRLLERALAFADTAPAAVRPAVAALARVEPAWRGRRAVPVHVFADEDLRARPGWRFRLRFLWRDATRTFEGLLDAHFYVASLGSFETADAGDALASLREAFRAQHPDPPPTGVLALFTGRAAPRRPGRHRLGVAELLGRRLLVRLDPEAELRGPAEAESKERPGARALAHEIAHLYGAVHVSPETESLLNPKGESRTLDRWNTRVMRAVHARRFGPGGFEANVLPFIELEETIRAYRSLLRANLLFRQLGMAEALEAGRESRYQGAARARAVQRLDPHLGDVAGLLAQLLLRDARPAPAAELLHVAARLHGPQSPKGRLARARARALEARLPGAAGSGSTE